MSDIPSTAVPALPGPSVSTRRSIYRRNPEDPTTNTNKLKHPTRFTMLGCSVVVACAATIAGGAFALTNTARPLPVVDLGYAVHQAAWFNASNGYYTFSNIRFGDAPIGPLRFRAPQAASPNRTLQTGHDGDPKCYQANPGWLAIAGKFIGPYLMGQTSAFYAQYPSQASIPTPDVPPADPSETEDCLFLDVKVPQSVIRHKNTTNKKIPVLIWLYGGGYTGGYKTQYSTDSLLARSRVDKGNGLILVQPNYRLGAFGFLSGGGYPGNAGLLDQRLALQWVQEHIGEFGGDPAQVTIMGESAGAGSIEYHLTARAMRHERRPLFTQAIMQSPFFFPDPGPAQRQARFEQFMRLAGLSSTDTALNASAETFRKANYQVVLSAPYGQFGFGPVIDNNYIFASPAAELLAGHIKTPLPQILGHNSAEGIGFTYPWVRSNDDFSAYVQKLFPAATKATVSYITNTIYPPPDSGDLPYKTNLDRAALITSDVVVDCNTYLLALAYQNTTYNYLFDVPPGLHGDDLHYTFGPDPSVKSDQIRQAIQDYIISFVSTGTPSGSLEPHFPEYGRSNTVLQLHPANIVPKPDPAASDRCILLQKDVWR